MKSEYETKHGECIGFIKAHGGYQWIMDDGSQHFSEKKAGEKMLKEIRRWHLNHYTPSIKEALGFVVALCRHRAVWACYLIGKKLAGKYD